MVYGYKAVSPSLGPFYPPVSTYLKNKTSRYILLYSSAKVLTIDFIPKTAISSVSPHYHKIYIDLSRNLETVCL